MAEPGIIVVLENAQNEAIVRRLVSGVIQQWDRIPKRVQGDILRDATVGLRNGPETTSYREQITAFIHKHGGDSR
jgi:hypothetical protein